MIPARILIKEIVNLEKEALEQGFPPIMKLFCFNEDGKINIFVIPSGWPKEGKRAFLLGLGKQIWCSLCGLGGLW